MNDNLTVLAVTAASMGLAHTLLGPDHYLPFVVMAKARKWPMAKTVAITVACGLGHIGSSVLLGMAGIALGLAVARIKALESLRGNLAAWALIAFGLAYCAWGLRRAWRSQPHSHQHFDGDGNGHCHDHGHDGGHVHVHQELNSPSLTPWILFTIFVFGPCEPLIPLLMYPAAQHNPHGVLVVASIFGLTTIGTMVGVVMISSWGIQLLPMAKLERYSHALAGAAIFLCGVAIQFLGL